MLDLKYKTILRVAVPLMVSSFIQSIVLITDASFISRYSTLAFDAVGNGGLIYVTMYMALAGMGDGAQIIIARRIGQENTNDDSGHLHDCEQREEVRLDLKARLLDEDQTGCECDERG